MPVVERRERTVLEAQLAVIAGEPQLEPVADEQLPLLGKLFFVLLGATLENVVDLVPQALLAFGRSEIGVTTIGVGSIALIVPRGRTAVSRCDRVFLEVVDRRGLRLVADVHRDRFVEVFGESGSDRHRFVVVGTSRDTNSHAPTCVGRRDTVFAAACSSCGPIGSGTLTVQSEERAVRAGSIATDPEVTASG